MYVIVRTMKMVKGNKEQVAQRFSNPSPVTKSPGFIRMEVLFSGKNPEYDIYQTMIYWTDKKAFYVWEGSPEHIAMHRNKDHEHNKRPEGILEVTHEAYEMIASKEHE
ncbi:conserved hypothetical protein [Alteracholeplasma palmae J233]|uniref:ABM domain-containing protein n=1 Tax=Alteracholeplasma palmae (strain ATCC 49389 / J233) TaxID=1318466 RepID=U4KRG7_ALTPJ|nr:antibiotic biosynthesis monooxygenase [Alteracholeplasma palmae]CCV64151.1 conserved hypothetical protein [Alteracholeplasma palmae J233]